MRSLLAGWLIGLVFAVLAGRAESGTVLFVDSYDVGYGWSDDILRGIEATLAGTGHALQVHHMDTKRHGTEAFKIEAGRRARQRVDEVKPDVVIACDDNAVKYLVASELSRGPLPVVFCGVNWDASKYGLPNGHVTGMVEVCAVRELLGLMRKFAKGGRIAFLAADTEAERLHFEAISQRFSDLPMQPVWFVSSMAGFEEAYADANANADMIVFMNSAGIADWDPQRAEAFIYSTARVVSGAFDRWMSPYVVFSVLKVGEEQGRWAAQTALKILAGTPAARIPVTANREGRVIINASLAEHLGITLPPTLLAVATEVIH